MIRHGAFIAVEVVGTILAGLAVLAAVLAWRLSLGPIEIDFLKPVLEQALDDPSRGVHVTIGSAGLAWGGFGRPLDLHARGVRVYGQGSRLIAAAPELGVSFDLRALVRGRLAPTRLDLIRPQLHAVRQADGSFALDIDAEGVGLEETAHGDAAKALFETLRRPPGAGDTGPAGALRQLSITGAELTVDDHQLGVMWRAERVDMTLQRDAGGIRGTTRIEIGAPPRTATIDVDVDYRNPSGTATLTGHLHGLDPAALFAGSPILAPMAGLGVTIDGTAWVDIGADLQVTAARYDLTTSAGTVALPALYDHPLAIRFAEARGSVDVVARHAVLDDLNVGFDGPTLSLTGSADIVGDRLDLLGEARVARLPVDDLARYWPAAVGANPRAWITSNLAQGMISGAWASFSASAPLADPAALDASRLQGGIEFDGVSVTYLPPLPPVIGVGGKADFDLQTMTLALNGGTLREIKLGETKAVITGLDLRDQLLTLDIPFSGRLGAVLGLLDQKPLGYPHRIGLDPAKVGGNASARLAVKLPLIKALGFDDVGLSASATLSNVSLPESVAGMPVTNGQLDLALDTEGMSVKGTCRLAAVPLAVDWRENFTRSRDYQTRLAVKGEVSAADRARLGFNTEPYASGPMGVSAVYRVDRNRAASVRADLDLTPTALSLPWLDWSKPAGTSGTAHVTARIENGAVTRLTDIVVDAGGLTARGDIEPQPGLAGIERAVLNSLELGETHLSATVARRPAGGYTVSLNGASLDARPLLSNHGASDEGRTGVAADLSPPLDLTLKLGRVVLGEHQALTDVVGTAARRAVGWSNASVDAYAGISRVPITLRLMPEADGQTADLQLQTNDAGAALTALDVVTTVTGGHLVITGRLRGGGAQRRVDGSITLTDFTVHNLPVLARILNATAPTGFAELLSGNGILFSHLVGDYWLEDGMIGLTNVRTSGSALGLTLSGRIELTPRRLDLEGTIVPVYGLNHILGLLPLVGNLLSGGEGQGLFAATYKVVGPIDDPSVSVNPLAMLAPGFLRNLLFLDSGTAGGSPPFQGAPQTGSR